MKKLIQQIICSFLAIVAVIGLTTGSANAQNISSVVNDTGNPVTVAIDNKDEANTVNQQR